jgi:hypothetical protein
LVPSRSSAPAPGWVTRRGLGASPEALGHQRPSGDPYGDPHQIELLGFLVGAVQSARPERLRTELAAAGLKHVTVEVVTEATEHQTGQDLWEWLVCSNPVNIGVGIK